MQQCSVGHQAESEMLADSSRLPSRTLNNVSNNLEGSEDMNLDEQ